MFFLYTPAVFVIFGCLVYYHFTRTFKYWQSKNVSGPQPLPFFGNIKNYVLRKSLTAEILKEIYDEYPNEKVVGIYRMTTPSLLIRDLDLVKTICVKDFDNFEDRGMELSKKGLGANLFHAESDIWRPLRSLFSPLFTTGKLKSMVHLVSERGDIFVKHIKQITEVKKDHEVYSLAQKFTMTSIFACIFGLNISSDSDLLVEKMTRINELSITRTFAQDLDLLYPGILKRFNFSFYIEELGNFFVNLVRDSMQAKNGVPSNRKDFIDLILEIKNQGDILETTKTEETVKLIDSVKLTDEVIAAQAFIFYAAGYETSATTVAFMLYELAMNPGIQDKLISELDEVLDRHDGNITYEIINELTYMEKVFNETLRKYPVTDIQRRAKANYNIPGTSVTIEKGTIVLIPTLAISHDEKYFPDPSKFDPERFSPENESKRHPCAFIPFGTGPRFCIGMLFAKIQSRVCVMKLLYHFRVEVCKNTPKTLSFDPQHVVPAPKGGIYLNIIPRK
ncbi:cytochrome P450 6B1-like [Bicyclus anynana]|uniref:unspecific monooxygenase n=1 Tax=Bicyclus anynana TaxID=110368 RepID=A0A6J1MHB4_BICAN|nr:cytochrome P450 6B1-like [Bicyclus anynana]